MILFVTTSDFPCPMPVPNLHQLVCHLHLSLWYAYCTGLDVSITLCDFIARVLYVSS